jgi:hypothetical protein
MELKSKRDAGLTFRKLGVFYGISASRVERLFQQAEALHERRLIRTAREMCGLILSATIEQNNQVLPSVEWKKSCWDKIYKETMQPKQ